MIEKLKPGELSMNQPAKYDKEEETVTPEDVELVVEKINEIIDHLNENQD